MSSVSLIQPIDDDRQAAVAAEATRYMEMASSYYNIAIKPIPVLFNLKGKVAGMYRVKQVRFGKPYREIRFNPWIFAKYPEDSWCNTIPHEVAHYIADKLHGFNNIKPHGKEWQQVMRSFGAEPLVRGSYSLEGIPRRAVKYYDYRCNCRQVQLSSYRHRKIQKGLQIYRCVDCHAPLELCDL